MDRAEVHAKIDELFDELDKYSKSNNDKLELQRLCLEAEPLISFPDSDAVVVAGAVLVSRERCLPDRPFISWRISPQVGLYAGHYDLSQANLEEDWPARLGHRRW